MPPRAPTPTDFSKHITLKITPPPDNKPAVNILILLHGLGDTHTPFTNLGQQLNLRETLCISLRAPIPLPAALDVGREGYHWGDDIVFDNSTGGIDVVDVPYNKSIQLLLDDVILGVLLDKCGYTLRDIVLFGLGQGGTIAMCVARECAKRGLVGELGGVVSLGGPLGNAFVREASGAKARTPVLVVHGSSGSAVTSSGAAAIKEAFVSAEEHVWKRGGDGMPTNREEMLPVMRFFARRLRSRAGVPSGAVEIA